MLSIREIDLIWRKISILILRRLMSILGTFRSEWNNLRSPSNWDSGEKLFLFWRISIP